MRSPLRTTTGLARRANLLQECSDSHRIIVVVFKPKWSTMCNVCRYVYGICCANSSSSVWWSVIVIHFMLSALCCYNVLYNDASGLSPYKTILIATLICWQAKNIILCTTCTLTLSKMWPDISSMKFHLVMSLPAMTFGDRFCFSKKDRIGKGGWVHLKGADSMAVSGLNFRSALVGSGWATAVLLCTNRLRKVLSTLHCKGLLFPYNNSVPHTIFSLSTKYSTCSILSTRTKS